MSTGGQTGTDGAFFGDGEVDNNKRRVSRRQVRQTIEREVLTRKRHAGCFYLEGKLNYLSHKFTGIRFNNAHGYCYSYLGA